MGKIISPQKSGSLTEAVEAVRAEAGRGLDAKKKIELAQFFTPTPVATFMASMIEVRAKTVRILDAGAGVGSLFSAAVAHLCQGKNRPSSIHVTAYELDEKLAESLRKSERLCRTECDRHGVAFTFELHTEDFLTAAADQLDPGLFGAEDRYHLAIINPPYYKINVGSATRQTLRRIGVESTNIYPGFLAAAAKLLEPGGELIAITPRSFCNGSYFRPFRQWFLEAMGLRRLHTFISRQEAFREDEVLQETVILRAVKGASRARVCVTASAGPETEMTSRMVDYELVVRKDDAETYIRIPSDDDAEHVADLVGKCRSSLPDLGLSVSTGRVVDFRAKPHLRAEPSKETVPLIYPMHFDAGYIAWPKPSPKKPTAIVACEGTKSVLVPNEHYVIVRRFSAKEERRRVVAAVYDSQRVKCGSVGFENHLNYFHTGGRGMDLTLARGLAAFLNSTILDRYFRQFSGHTQVNATDLKNMHYPSLEELVRMGGQIGDEFPDQEGTDALVTRELFEKKRKRA